MYYFNYGCLLGLFPDIHRNNISESIFDCLLTFFSEV
jgi:TctA family transporter